MQNFKKDFEQKLVAIKSSKCLLCAKDFLMCLKITNFFHLKVLHPLMQFQKATIYYLLQN